MSDEHHSCLSLKTNPAGVCTPCRVVPVETPAVVRKGTDLHTLLTGRVSKRSRFLDEPVSPERPIPAAGRGARLAAGSRLSLWRWRLRSHPCVLAPPVPPRRTPCPAGKHACRAAPAQSAQRRKMVGDRRQNRRGQRMGRSIRLPANHARRGRRAQTRLSPRERSPHRFPDDRACPVPRPRSSKTALAQ